MLKNSTDQQRKPTPASWKPGQSGNPKGRPRTGLALAERIREKLDPDKIIALADRLADDESVPLKDRLAALLQLAAMGYTKPPTITDVNVTANATPRRFENLTADELRAEIAARRAQLGLAAGSATVEATDGVIDIVDGDRHVERR